MQFYKNLFSLLSKILVYLNFLCKGPYQLFIAYCTLRNSKWISLNFNSVFPTPIPCRDGIL